MPGWRHGGMSSRGDVATPARMPEIIREAETPMSIETFNKYRAAAQALQRGRDQLVESMANRDSTRSPLSLGRHAFDPQQERVPQALGSGTAAV